MDIGIYTHSCIIVYSSRIHTSFINSRLLHYYYISRLLNDIRYNVGTICCARLNDIFEAEHAFSAKKFVDPGINGAQKIFGVGEGCSGGMHGNSTSGGDEGVHSCKGDCCSEGVN